MQAPVLPHLPLPGGRCGARRPAVLLAMLLTALGAATAAAAGQQEPAVTVREDAGVFTVTAHFDVPQPPAAVLAVLTDYEGIPRVMPDVTRSVVRSRGGERVVVEQEAVSRVLFFSRTVHLLLDVREAATSLTFRDVCGRSFTLYEGGWHLAASGGGTRVTYELRAQPGFEVPDFLLKRLFRRDAGQLIERLRQAIGS